MINYSVFMQMNALKPDQPEKAYARAQVNEVMTFEKFVRHIADHNGVFSRGTVKGVVSDMCVCLVEQLLNGNKVQLGEFRKPAFAGGVRSRKQSSRAIGHL